MSMKSICVLCATLPALALTGACGSGKSVSQSVNLDGEWNIITVGGEPAEAQNTVYIGMDLQAGRLYGCAGCNRIMGTMEADAGGRLSFGAVGSTRMICPSMSTERAVLNALGNVAGYNGTEQSLSLTDNGGNTLLTLSKRPATMLASLQGKWTITHVDGKSASDIESTDDAPFLDFDTEEKTVNGFTGCNTLNGTIVQEDEQPSSLRFTGLISTLTSGPGMTLEAEILAALPQVTYFAVKDRLTVVLCNENGKELLTLVSTGR